MSQGEAKAEDKKGEPVNADVVTTQQSGARGDAAPGDDRCAGAFKVLRCFCGCDGRHILGSARSGSSLLGPERCRKIDNDETVDGISLS